MSRLPTLKTGLAAVAGAAALIAASCVVVLPPMESPPDGPELGCHDGIGSEPDLEVLGEFGELGNARLRSSTDGTCTGEVLGSRTLVVFDANLSPPPGSEDSTLLGQGAAGAVRMSDDWSQVFFESPAQLVIDYLGTGEGEARRVFLEGQTDYLVSGTPLSQADKDAVGGVVSAPVRGVGMTALLAAPYGQRLRWCASGYEINLATFSFECASGEMTARQALGGQPGDNLKLEGEALAVAIAGNRIVATCGVNPVSSRSRVPGSARPI